MTKVKLVDGAIINAESVELVNGVLKIITTEGTVEELAVITDERYVYMGFPGGEAEKIVLEKDFTSESIKEKLGYEPADEERVDQLFRDKADYQYVDKKVSNVKVDLTGYAKEDYVDDEIEELNKKIVQETGKLSQEKADQTAIPTKTSQLTNDSGFLTEKPTYTASEVGADASGTAQTKVSEHNVSEESHTDIRLLISNLTTRLNTIANSEDVDLDQLSELVAYIKANRTLIESVTTNKVNVSDIIDNLTTSVSNKPLSAKQGKLLQDQVTELNTKFINEERKNIASINEFKQFLISRMGDDCFCIYAVSGCSAVFGVDDLIIGTATTYKGNYVFDGISHWNDRRWYGRFTNYDDTWGIKEE